MHLPSSTWSVHGAISR